MMGILFLPVTLAQLIIADICGKPAPEITLVVQIAPGPMPTLTAFAPAAIKSSAALAVAILPAITAILCLALIFFTVSITFCEWP